MCIIRVNLLANLDSFFLDFGDNGCSTDLIYWQILQLF